MGIIIKDNEYLPQAKALIENAKRQISISVFKAEITEKPRGNALRDFFRLLYEKAKTGVKIRFLINWHTDRRSVPNTNVFAMQELGKHNIRVRHLRNNRCCHAKLVIVDNTKAIIGSHNLSVKSCHNNFEVSYLIPDPEAIAELASIFDRTWQDAQAS